MKFKLIDEYLALIKKVSFKKKLRVLISIQNTNNIDSNYYLLPPRISNKYLICGICNSQEDSLNYFLNNGLNLTNIILLDVEIKKPFFATENKIKFHNYQDYLKYKFPNIKIYYFSANLLTIQSVLRRIYNKKESLSNNNALLVGLGNIGIKLCLSLLDLRINSVIFSSDQSKIQSLNNIVRELYLFPEVKNIFRTSNKLEEAIENKNLLILCTPSVNVLNANLIRKMDDFSSIISLSSLPYDDELTAVIKSKNIKFEYANIGFELLSYIDYLDFISNSFVTPARSIINDKSYVSGGFRGVPGDIVVDNAIDPIFQIGTIKGNGKFSSLFKLIKDD